MSNLERRLSRASSSSAVSRTTNAWRLCGVVNVALGLFVFACSSDDQSGASSGTGGAPASSSGGKAATTGGTLSSTGGAATGGTTGGSKSTPTGGTTASGGSGGAATGGSGTATGGTMPKAGSGGDAGGPSKGGAGGGGGAPSSGGTTSGGGASGASGAGGASGGSPNGGTTSGAGGSGTGACEKGTTKGSEVLFIGESFVAASSIPEETSKLAREAGSLSGNDSYVDKSVSGTWIGNGASNSIPSQYRNNSNGVRFVLMNGGGNDCWQGGQASDRTNALNAAKSLFQDMEENGVEKIVYFFYPDPIGNQFASLTACLDLLRPEMKALCDAQTAPKCYWVDLRETWDGHPEYTSDGIHVAGPGNVPTATAIWEAMEANCVAP